jgi:hypothetical protein
MAVFLCAALRDWTVAATAIELLAEAMGPGRSPTIVSGNAAAAGRWATVPTDGLLVTPDLAAALRPGRTGRQIVDHLRRHGLSAADARRAVAAVRAGHTVAAGAFALDKALALADLLSPAPPDPSEVLAAAILDDWPPPRRTDTFAARVWLSGNGSRRAGLGRAAAARAMTWLLAPRLARLALRKAMSVAGGRPPTKPRAPSPEATPPRRAFEVIAEQIRPAQRRFEPPPGGNGEPPAGGTAA